MTRDRKKGKERSWNRWRKARGRENKEWNG